LGILRRHGRGDSGRRSPAGGSFQTPLTLTTDEAEAVDPEIGLDASGDAVAVWTQADGEDRRVAEALRPEGGSFGAAEEVSSAGGDAYEPMLAVSAGGGVIFTWVRESLEGFLLAQASTSAVGGGFSAPIDLSESGFNALGPVPAIDSGGAATVVWKRLDGSNYIAQGTNLTAAGAPAPPANLSSPGSDAVAPTVARDGAGDATAVWWRSDGTDTIVQEAGYDGDPPTLNGISAPTRATVGDPVTFSDRPFDVWPIARTSFEFGDGEEAVGAQVTHAYPTPGTYRVTATAEDAAGTMASASGSIQVLASNEFSLGRFSPNRRRGTGKLAVTVSGPGTLTLAGKSVRKARETAARAGGQKLPVAASGKGLQGLKAKGRLKVRLKVTFLPAGGEGRTKEKAVALVKRPRRP
jgi:hypothetical protein